MSLAQTTGADKALLGRKGFAALTSKSTYLGRSRNPETGIVPSMGHIEFTPDGIERYVRDGYVYQAFANTPVFADGYRMGAIEGAFSADEYRLLQHHAEHEALHAASLVVQQANPAKYERCVRDVQASDARSGRPVNAYAVCTAAGTRNPGDLIWNVSFSDGGRVRVEAKSHAEAKRKGVAEYKRQSGKSRVKPTSIYHSYERRNPEDAADALYEEFHGTPPTETLEYREQLRVHGHLAGLGDLVHIVVKLTAGMKAGSQLQLNAPDPSRAEVSDIVRLTSNEDKSQLYFTGGDQSLDLNALGFRESFTINHDGESFDATDFKDLMEIGRIVRVMYRTEKEFDDFETIDYFHMHGEDTKKYPLLLYDNLNQKILTAGGEYSVSAAGIVN